MSIKGQGHSLTLVKGHADFKVKCLTFGLYTPVSDSGPLGPLVFIFASHLIRGQLLKKRICSPWSKLFPLRVDPILKGLHFPGKQTELKKLSPFLNMAEKDGGITIYLKVYI